MRFRMKPLLLVAFFAATAVMAALYVQAGPQGPSVQSAPGQRVIFQVQGLTCGSCEGRVRAALTAKPGVTGVDVDLAQKTVAVQYQPGKADAKDLADTITRLGYPARYVSSGPATGSVAPAQARPAGSGGCGGGCCAG